MPLSPAGSKHESPESPPPEPPPPPERQPRASAGEPGSVLREDTRLDPTRGPAGPRSPKLAAPARMEEPAPGAIVVRIGIPDLQQTGCGAGLQTGARHGAISALGSNVAAGPALEFAIRASRLSWNCLRASFRFLCDSPSLPLCS
ncbi:forkhead box protein D1-like [Coturnix japonica]|uniref:forkhead box protein D1-like n=1 Tax=Coturnix japonica TaxID=93934 RepID=UPI000776BA20|nr:forkhead box protein D1-like [Coturnix japonica]XP_032302470.1 forkhead box protein D1-like [Coturnix japonica]XP_032302479.1 forkhead box protein D1-like [Coturnix japonica]